VDERLPEEGVAHQPRLLVTLSLLTELPFGAAPALPRALLVATTLDDEGLSRRVTCGPLQAPQPGHPERADVEDLRAQGSTETAVTHLLRQARLRGIIDPLMHRESPRPRPSSILAN